MRPEKRKRARERAEEWARTDPSMQRLSEMIEKYRRLNEERRAAGG